MSKLDETITLWAMAQSGRIDELSDAQLKTLRFQMFAQQNNQVHGLTIMQLIVNEEAGRRAERLSRSAVTLTVVAVILGITQVLLAVYGH